jgi:hypothetical protein
LIEQSGDPTCEVERIAILLKANSNMTAPDWHYEHKKMPVPDNNESQTTAIKLAPLGRTFQQSGINEQLFVLVRLRS